MSNYVNAGIAITPDDVNALNVSIAAGEYLDNMLKSIKSFIHN